MNYPKDLHSSLDNWFNSHQGFRVAEAFCHEIRQFKRFLRGETLLQLGSCGKNIWLEGLKYNNKWLASPEAEHGSCTLVSDFNALAIDRDSIDCIIAPFSLELYSFKKNPLSEIDRVLKPMGYVIFLGINPWGIWGSFAKLGWLTSFNKQKLNPVSAFTLKSNFISHGYQQCNHSSFYYLPPVKSLSWLNRLEFLNEMSKMIWPYPAGFYCLILQKYQECMPGPSVTELKEKTLLDPDPALLLPPG